MGLAELGEKGTNGILAALGAGKGVGDCGSWSTFGFRRSRQFVCAGSLELVEEDLNKGNSESSENGRKELNVPL